MWKYYRKLIFRYFNIRNFKIPKYRSFDISSFQILTPAQSYVTSFLFNNFFN